MDWLLEVQSAPADPAVRARFDAWLARDPSHAGAWDRARHAWTIVGDVPPAHADVARAHTGRSRWPVVNRYWGGIAAAAVAACLVLAIAASPSGLVALRADYATGTAETRVVALDDGTKIHLGPHSAIDAHVGADSRTVALLAGEAWFEVVHDAARPFTVRAGGVDIQDIGTAFEVRMTGADTRVAVAQGVVQVRAQGQGGAVDARLMAGDSLAVDGSTGRAEAGRVPVDDVALWRDGWLATNNMTVAEVVERLRAYQPGWIMITDDALARRRVTGLLDLRKPEAAMQALVEAGGGRVRRVTPLLYVLSVS